MGRPRRDIFFDVLHFPQMDGSVFTRASQEVLLVVGYCNGIYRVSMLVKSRD